MWSIDATSSNDEKKHLRIGCRYYWPSWVVASVQGVEGWELRRACSSTSKALLAPLQFCHQQHWDTDQIIDREEINNKNFRILSLTLRILIPRVQLGFEHSFCPTILNRMRTYGKFKICVIAGTISWGQWNNNIKHIYIYIYLSGSVNSSTKMIRNKWSFWGRIWNEYIEHLYMRQIKFWLLKMGSTRKDQLTIQAFAKTRAHWRLGIDRATRNVSTISSYNAHITHYFW